MRQRKKWLMRRVERLRSSLFDWLEKSNVPSSLWPTVGEISPKGFRLIYTQMAEALSIYVTAQKGTYYELNIFVDYDGRFWDIVLWLDVSEVRKCGRYTCELCSPKEKNGFFLSRTELYADHLWTPLFAWLQENLQPDKVLCMFQSENGGSTWAQILTETGAAQKSSNKTFVHSVSVLQRNGYRLNQK